MTGPRGILSKTGVSVDALLLERVSEGWGEMADFSIARETLLHQAEVAAAGGHRQLAENFRRAAELVGVPDKIILQIYDTLRPFRATQPELEALADQLRTQFQAPECARWVEEAGKVYARRGLLRAADSAKP
jgi:propanediol dehydratase small subunit